MALGNERIHRDNAPESLLAADEPNPVTVTNEGGRSPFVIVADHAGKYLPRRLHRLGLEEAECERHIAWDIGAGTVSGLIGDALDAVVIRQNYSRLAIDCNRRPGSETSIVELSELTTVPGNIGLSEAQMEARVREIFQPYHDRIAGELDRRRQLGQPTALIAMHSFTPVFKAQGARQRNGVERAGESASCVPVSESATRGQGQERPWHVGVLYNRDPRLANILMDLLRCEQGLVVGNNQPYSVTDESDYTIPIHGEQRDLPHVAIEIRQDLIVNEAGQRRWAGLFAQLLPKAYQRIAETGLAKR